MTESAPIVEAAALVARGEWAGAIAKLSAAWREAPSARIGRLVAQLEERLGSPGPVPAERWLAVARSQDGSMLRALLAAPWPDTVRRACERVEVLARWPRSPQIANALLALHRRELYAHNTAQRHLIRAVFALLVGYGDPATTEYLEEMRSAQARSTAAYAAYCIASALQGRPPPVEPVPTPEVEAALASMERIVRPPAAAATREALLQAVYDEPHEDGPRLVLADLLTTAGDPRGEFIHLQLQRHRGEARQEAIRREAALLRQAGNRWFDGLDEDARGIRLERGFPAAATTWTCQFRAPAWATVEALEIEPLPRAHEFRGSPLLRGLRRLYGLDPAQLGHVSVELDVLTVRDVDGLDAPTVLAPAALGLGSSGTDRSPDERARYTADVARIAGSLAALPIGRRVRELVLGLGIGGLPFAVELLAANPRLDEVALHGSASRTLYEPVSWTAAVSRRTLHLRWCGEPRYYNPVDFSTIVTVLRELARPGFEELEIVTSKRAPQLAEVREQLRSIAQGWPRLQTATIFGSRLRS